MTRIEEFSTPRQVALVTTRNKTEKISGRIETTDNISIITANIVDILTVISFHVGIIIGT